MTAKPEPSEVVASFESRHGRRPRVLHIGNIANNAYLNAKLLNDAGYECDVICHDYYHIMGCPEWEDADFNGEVGDQFRPDWRRVDLGGFVRPRWFVQGPQQQCVDYLLARRNGDSVRAERLWQTLGEFNHTVTRRPLMEAAEVRHWVVGRAIELRITISRWRGGRDVLRRCWMWLDPLRRRRVPGVALAWIIAVTMMIVVAPAALLLSVLRVLRNFQHWLMVYLRPRFATRAFDLIREFAAQFPGRGDRLTLGDLLPFALLSERWQRLFDHYDFILAYSTDGFLPLLAARPYFAFEHGTLREIPFGTTAEARRTALAYRLSQHVFVTNFDCLPNAALLAPGRYTLINHPFDEDHGYAAGDPSSIRQTLCAELDAEILFFFPTRHDWVKGTGHADKGNDVFLRGLAGLRHSGFKVGAVCCEWGANVAQSQSLLMQLGVDGHVKWTPPLPTVQFERMASAADCVVDQFVLGSFGGVMFKAMAVGAPVVTYLDEAQLLRQYPECPPVVNCRTPEQVVSALSSLLRTPADLAAMGAAGRRWMKMHHSKAATVLAQSRVFAALEHDTGVAPAARVN